MNYIPVKDFNLDNPVAMVSGAVVLAMLIIAGFFLFLMHRVGDRGRESTADKLFFTAVSMGVVAVFAGLVGCSAFFYDLIGFDRLSERNQAAQAQIEKDYDLKLDRTEFHDLYYPQFKPQEDFAVYGSIQKNLPLADGAYRSAKLSLVWSEGKFYLSESTNGEDFTPLKPKG